MRENSLVRCGVGENPEEAMSGYATHCNQKITYHYPMPLRRSAPASRVKLLRRWVSTLQICATTAPATGAMWDPASSAISVLAWTTEPVQPMAGTAA